MQLAKAPSPKRSRSPSPKRATSPKAPSSPKKRPTSPRKQRAKVPKSFSTIPGSKDDPNRVTAAKAKKLPLDALIGRANALRRAEEDVLEIMGKINGLETLTEQNLNSLEGYDDLLETFRKELDIIDRELIKRGEKPSPFLIGRPITEMTLERIDAGEIPPNILAARLDLLSDDHARLSELLESQEALWSKGELTDDDWKEFIKYYDEQDEKIAAEEDLIQDYLYQKDPKNKDSDVEEDDAAEFEAKEDLGAREPLDPEKMSMRFKNFMTDLSRQFQFDPKQFKEVNRGLPIQRQRSRSRSRSPESKSSQRSRSRSPERKYSPPRDKPAARRIVPMAGDDLEADVAFAPIFKKKPRTLTRLSPTSPKKASPKRLSPKAASPKRTSPKRASPKAASPKRLSPKRESPKRLSPKLDQSFIEATARVLRNRARDTGRSPQELILELFPRDEDEFIENADAIRREVLRRV